MSRFETMMQGIANDSDAQIDAIESQGADVLNSFDPMSRLHDLISDPVTEGIDEG